MNQNIKIAHQSNATVLPNGTLQSRNCYETRRNNNYLIFGTSGSGKTRNIVKPNICSMVGSYVISDPKGNLYRNYATMFLKNGYKVTHMDFIHPECSQNYNPLHDLHTSDDIMKLSKMIVYSDYTGKENDPFWNHAALMLLSALISFLIEVRDLKIKYHDMELACWNCYLMEIPILLTCMNPDAISKNKICQMDKYFQILQRLWRQYTGKESSAYRQWKKFTQNPEKTLATVIMTLNAKLAELDTEGIRKMTSSNDICMDEIGMKKSAIFVEISDTDRSKDLLANIFYWQAMNRLCTIADAQSDSQLPVPVQFILDDFGTNCRIEGFENMIANIRSRGISAMLMLQSASQLEASYQVSAHTIMENCDTTIYMGGNDYITAELIAKRCNVPVHRILNMPVGTNWIIRRGIQPQFHRTVDFAEYELPLEHRFSIDRNNTERIF